MSQVDETERRGRAAPPMIDFELNYATPLIGQFLNLPNCSARVLCPSCGCYELTEYEHDLTNRSECINGLFQFLYVYCCLCCCMEPRQISNKTHGSHYCKNCGCYFGRYMNKRKIITIKK